MTDPDNKLTLREIVSYLYNEEHMQCNCDLDNWEPTGLTGHSEVCRIHKESIRRYHSQGK